MSLLLIAPYDGTVRWQRGERGIMPPSDTTTAQAAPWYGCLPLNNLTQRAKWGLGQDASCYFRSFDSVSASLSISLSVSLLRNSQKQSQTHWNLANEFIFLLFPSQALVCQKVIQREKKSLAEQVHLFIPLLLPANGTKLVPSPACLSFLLLKSYWGELA